MNRFTNIALASSLVIIGLTGAASAAGIGRAGGAMEDAGHGTNADLQAAVAPATGSGAAVRLAAYAATSGHKADSMIRAWKDGRFDVVPVDSLDDSGMKASLQDRERTEPKQVAALQAAIRHNAVLVKRLEAQKVEIGNIIEAEPALDGTLTFYVR